MLTNLGLNIVFFHVINTIVKIFRKAYRGYTICSGILSMTLTLNLFSLQNILKSQPYRDQVEILLQTL